jgi:hypothetical protein
MASNQSMSSQITEPVPRSTSKPELGEIVVFTDNRS